MNTKRNLKNIVVILLLLLSYSVNAQNETDWKELIIKAKEKEVEKIKTLSFDKNAIESGKKQLDMNMIFYLKSSLIESDEKHHLVLPFYVSDGKSTALLFTESIFNYYSSWNVINQNGEQLASSCRVIKEPRGIKAKYWTRQNELKDLKLNKNVVYYFLGGNKELKQNLMQGRTNYLVFTQSKKEHDSMKGLVFGMPFGVYLLSNGKEYLDLVSYFKEQ